MRTSTKKAVNTIEFVHKGELSLAVIYSDINQLKPNPKNPRTHSKEQLQKLERSMKRFGFVSPVLVDRSGQIVAGHGRVEAAKALGMKQVPTICLDYLTDAELSLLMIADNRLTELGDWDEQLLAEQLKILSELDLHFDLEVTGFEMGEIDVILERHSSASTDGVDTADELPELNPQVQVARSNDIWLLNRHRIVCGNALDEHISSLVMDNQRANAAFTDPPYNLAIDGFVTRSNKVRHAEFAMASGEMSEPEFREFLQKCCSLLARHSLPGALHYICMDWRHARELLTAAEAVFAEFKNLCVWIKDMGGQGSLYRSQHELVFVFKTTKDKHRNNVQLGKYGRYRTNVWHYPRVNSFGKTNSEGEFTLLHPTVKPVSLVADAILDCTALRDIVLDPFLGSGTTLIAAERVGRVCYGIELSPAYVDLIIRRWQAFTGQTAIHCQSGQTFREREEVSGEKE